MPKEKNICKDLSFADCELAILRMAVDEAEEKTENTPKTPQIQWCRCCLCQPNFKMKIKFKLKEIIERIKPFA